MQTEAGMSAPKHTPGPWIAHPWRHGSNDPRWRVIQLGSSGGSPGLAVIHPRWNAPADTAEANARLIAAAPELLAALIAMVKTHVNYAIDEREYDEERPNQWLDDQCEEVGKAAVAAIAKATGSEA